MFGGRPPHEPLNRLRDLYLTPPTMTRTEAYWRSKSKGSVSKPSRTLKDDLENSLAALTGDSRYGRHVAKRATGFLNDLTPVGDAISVDEARRSWQRGNYGQAAIQGGLAALAAIPGAGDAAAGTLKAIIAPLYHGSPYKFDRFSLDKIGTGEGNQMYGQGIYLAESPAVASTYAIPRRAEPLDVPPEVRDPLRDALASQDYLGFDTFGQAINAIRAHRTDWHKRWDIDNQQQIEAALQKYEAARWRPHERPTLYETSVNANPEDFADWDELGPRAERVARQKGMAGIRYLDQGSRGAGQGTRNYVVFDDSLIDILNRR